MSGRLSDLTPLAAAPDLVRRFRLTIMGMLGVFARVVLRRPEYIKLAVPLWNYMTRAVRRLERALARSGPARARAGTTGRERGTRKARVRWPGGKGWLVREFGWEIAVFGSGLRLLLDDPAMQAAMTRPDVARILRPVCAMLMFELPAGLAVAKAAAPVRPAKAVPALAPPRASESERERVDAVMRTVGFAKIR